MTVFEQFSGKSRCITALLAVLLFSLCDGLVGSVFAADQEVIAVVYPDIRQFRDIFSEITHGIESESHHKVLSYTISDDFHPDDFTSWAHALNVKVIIAIGNSGMKAAESVKGEIPIISNAFLVPDKKDNITGISLAVDPIPLFNLLSAIAPNVKRVSVVYNPEISGWLIDIAKPLAKNLGLNLIAYEANDIKSAARLYVKILDQSKPNEDAIWLPQDKTTVNDEVILPLILKEAWNRSVVFFSSIGTHAKNGALFSLYPDYTGLGKSLATMANEYYDNKSKTYPKIVPLDDLQIAVNIRTADHLNLNINKTGEKYDLVFPSPSE